MSSEEKNSDAMDIVTDAMDIVKDDLQLVADPSKVGPDISPPVKQQSEGNVKLVAQDGVVFTVPVEVARMSKQIRSVIDDFGEITDQDEPFPVSLVTSDILTKVIEFCTHYIANPPPSLDSSPKPGTNAEPGYNFQTATANKNEKKKYESVATPWDKEWLKGLSNYTLFKLVSASNQLDIEPLLKVTAEQVASMIHSLMPDEIREKFGIKTPWTQQQYDAILAENQWCERESS
jgi:S-phase kinase-associated protein 1